MFQYYALFAALIVAVDQISKYFVARLVPLYQQIPLVPGVLALTHVRNEGAAFSSFEGMQGMFTLIFVIFSAAVLYEYFKKPMPFAKAERWCIAAIYGGGLGNMVDRLRQGYVVDMFQTVFMDFPVFNVADCFITCGCACLIVHMALFNRKFWKDDKKK